MKEVSSSSCKTAQIPFGSFKATPFASDEEVKDEIKFDYDKKRRILKGKLDEKELLLDLDETLKKKIDELRLVFM